jgi:uncharacterized membrane protein YjjP (DUF1212 family)
MMNKALNEFEALVVRAKQEELPVVNVAHQVMYRIESAQSRYDRPLALVAAWSTFAALMVAMLSGYSVYTSADSLSPIFALASTMTP